MPRCHSASSPRPTPARGGRSARCPNRSVPLRERRDVPPPAALERAPGERAPSIRPQQRRPGVLTGLVPGEKARQDQQRRARHRARGKAPGRGARRRCAPGARRRPWRRNRCGPARPRGGSRDGRTTRRRCPPHRPTPRREARHERGVGRLLAHGEREGRVVAGPAPQVERGPKGPSAAWATTDAAVKSSPGTGADQSCASADSSSAAPQVAAARTSAPPSSRGRDPVPPFSPLTARPASTGRARTRPRPPRAPRAGRRRRRSCGRGCAAAWR